jgi:hypothetical protein
VRVDVRRRAGALKGQRLYRRAWVEQGKHDNRPSLQAFAGVRRGEGAYRTTKPRVEITPHIRNAAR